MVDFRFKILFCSIYVLFLCSWLFANTCANCDTTFWPREGENGRLCGACVAAKNSKAAMNVLNNVMENSRRAAEKRRKDDQEAAKRQIKSMDNAIDMMYSRAIRWNITGRGNGVAVVLVNKFTQKPIRLYDVGGSSYDRLISKECPMIDFSELEDDYYVDKSSGSSFYVFVYDFKKCVGVLELKLDPMNVPRNSSRSNKKNSGYEFEIDKISIMKYRVRIRCIGRDCPPINTVLEFPQKQGRDVGIIGLDFKTANKKDDDLEDFEL